MGRDLQQVAALAQHAAEVGLRRLRAETEEAQARGFQDHPADRGGHADDDARKHVGQKLGQHDPGIGQAAQARRRHEVGAHDRQGGPAHTTGEERHVDHDDGQHRVEQSRTKGRNDGEREQEVGEGHQRIDGAHQRRVEPAAPERRQEADGGADEARHQRREDADREAQPGSPDQPRQDIPPDLIGAEHVIRRQGWLQALRQMGDFGRLERQHRRQDHDRDDDQQEHQAEGRHGVSRQACPGRRAGVARRLAGGHRPGGCGGRAHAARIRGSSIACAKSVSRLIST